MVHQNAVVEHRQARRTNQRLPVEVRGLEHDVVGLPLARRTAGVDQGRVLPVHRRRLAVGVGLVLVAVEDLDLVAAHEEDAGVAPVLGAALRRGGGGELQVQLDVAELLAGGDGPRAVHDHGAVLELPCGVPAAPAPRVEVRAVEEDHGVGWRGSDLGTRGHDRGPRTLPVDLVGLPRELRGVVVGHLVVGREADQGQGRGADDEERVEGAQGERRHGPESSGRPAHRRCIGR